MQKNKQNKGGSKAKRFDFAHLETDRKIREIEKRLNEEYKQAEKELAEKVDSYFRGFQKKDEAKKKLVAEGSLSQEEYMRWRQGALMGGERWNAVKEVMSEDLKHTREIAKAIANGENFDVYALNYNFATYQIEHTTGINTNFALYDHDTVAYLVQDGKVLIGPGKKLSKEIAEGKAKAWTDRQISSVTLQAILQGESIPHMAKRICETLGEREKKAAIRTARTACTSAENAGRMASYKRAESMGIKLQRQWLSAHDERTRDWHRKLDGQRKPLDEPFVNDWGKIMYPGDPAAHPANVYNCRCTLIAAVEGHEIDGRKAYSDNNEMGGQSYEEWKRGHKYATLDYKKVEKGGKVFLSKVKEGIVKFQRITTMDEQYYISEKANVKPKKLHEIELAVKNAQIAVNCDTKKPKIVIVGEGELSPTTYGRYIGETNTMYIKPIENKEQLKHMIYHEFFHWKDRNEYSDVHGEINDDEFIKIMCKKAKNKLDKIGITKYNVSEISDYAEYAFVHGRYDEVYTEYRTKIELLRR